MYPEVRRLARLAPLTPPPPHHHHHHGAHGHPAADSTSTPQQQQQHPQQHSQQQEAGEEARAAHAACSECEREHESEASALEDLGRLLADVRAFARRGRKEVAQMLHKLCTAAEQVRSRGPCGVAGPACVRVWEGWIRAGRVAGMGQRAAGRNGGGV